MSIPKERRFHKMFQAKLSERTGCKASVVSIMPVKVELKQPDHWPRVKQYPPEPEAVKGILPVTNRLFEQGFIRPRRCPRNIPTLPIKKARE